MLNLHTIFTVEKDLLTATKSRQTEIRLVGEEHDGCLLYVWDDSLEESSQPVTHVGFFDWTTKHNEILHVFEKKLNIIQASVSQDGNFLAFVIKEEVTSYQGFCHYEAFVVPVKAKNDLIYNLNIRRQTLIKVQFRYRKGNPKPSTESTIKKKLNNQLIIFIHKEVIEVRHIVQNLENKEITEVETLETIVKTFLWSQWSPLEQCLYYLHYRYSLKTAGEETSQKKPLLTCIQFHDIVHYETVLNIPLDLPNLTPDTCSQIGKYEDDPLSQKVTDHHIKLEILTQSTGIVCICYQYQFECLYSSIQSPQDSSGGVVNFAYSVFLLHQDCILQCVIPGVPVVLANSIKILFTFFEDNHILAIAPGIFTHLLDVGLQHEPCNHILAQDFIQWTRSLTTWKCCKFSGSSVIWLSSENRGVHVEVNPDGLLEQFQHTQHSSTRRAIVHYLIAHIHADHSLLEKLLITLLQNALGIEVPKILQELLIGGAFMWIQTQIKPEFLKLLPFTFSESLEPQLEQGYNSINQLQITYTPLSNTSTMLLSPSQRLRPIEVNQWTNLWRHLDSASSRPITRFSAKGLRHRFVSMDFLQRSESPLPSPTTSDCSVSSNPKKEVIIEESDLNTVINKALRNSTSLSAESGGDTDGIKLIFPEKDSFTHNSQFEQVVSLTLQELSAHILKYFRNEPLNYIHQVSTEYIASQLYMSRLLCHLLISSLVPVIKKEKSDDPVQKPYSFLSLLTPEKESSLFYLMECYQLSVEEIAFPLPQGFTSFIGILGFRCLNFKMFLQYVQRGALLLKSEVVKYIMEELNDSQENATIKLEVILRLPKNKSKIFLETWNHPYGESIRAREQCKVLMETQDDQKQGFELLPVINPMEELFIDKESDGEGYNMDPSIFPPFYCFLKLLEFKEAETQQNTQMQVDLDLIKRMSFPYSLKQATCCPTSSCTETK